MKNVVIIHLESLNYMNYRLNNQLFDCLQNFEKDSLSFSKHFSSATSTLMIVGDWAYGGLLQYECCNSLDYIPNKYCYKESLFDELKDLGYRTEILVYPDGGDRESAEERHIVGFKNEMRLVKVYENYVNKIDEIISDEKPFALMLCNYISNVSFTHHIPGGRLESGLDRWRSGYQRMDACVADVLELLKKKDVLDNTVVICYGDHGDDYLEHGDHGGLTHAIEPYANLIHTPFWIYDKHLIEKGKCSQLISSVDIKAIVEKTMLLEHDYRWEDLNVSQRKYAVSRNAYAAQPVREGTFNKGYSITDGRYLLMVSNLGMEMYDIEMDTACQNNLLRYFKYEDGILRLDDELNNTLRYHYRSIINMSSIRKIRQVFYYYVNKLKEEVGLLYNYGGCADKMAELRFDIIRYSN